ncbi:hypothetical protein N9L19_01180 [bacterium]|nr:hypothetical protein [bacterium]
MSHARCDSKSNDNNNDNDNNNKNNNNSPGQRPIGVLDPPPRLGVCFEVPRPRKVGAPGPSAAEVGPTRSPPPPLNRCQGHGDLLFAMDPVDAFTMTPKNAAIRAVDRLGFCKRLF